MFIGAYLCVSIGVFLLGLLVLMALDDWSVTARSMGRRILSYTALSLSASLLGLMAFIVFSILAGLLPFRGAGSWSYPADYFSAGPIGWAIFILPLLGIFAPLGILFWLRPQSRDGDIGTT
jgi:hypothetical protein